MKAGKKLCILAIVAIMLFTTVLNTVCTYAATTNAKIEEATKMADELKELGLFYGTGKGYELERAGTRAEAITMLIRLLGEEKRADRNYQHPFTDVPAWADKYVSYGYFMEYTYGISNDRFGANDNVSASQYITFVLRALGYSEKEDGYTWYNPFEFAEAIGLMNKDEYSNDSEFIRADMVILSYRALDIYYKNQDFTLRKKLSGKEFVNTKGQGHILDAGVFNTPDDKLVTVDKSLEYRANLTRLNHMIGNAYGFYSYRPVLTQYGYNELVAEFLYDEATNRYGVEIFGWRKSYDTDSSVNDTLNCVLETFYFLCGDKEVSYALWSWVDAASINGYANTDDFGFRDTRETGAGFVIEMNGTEIEVISGDGKIRMYFN